MFFTVDIIFHKVIYGSKSGWFDAPFIDIPAQIWNTVDAIHLMTYDQNQSTWEWEWKWPDAKHSDAASSIAAIDE